MRVTTMLAKLPYTRVVKDAKKRPKGTQVKVPVPRDLQAVIGKTALTRFYKTPAEYAVALEGFLARIEQARHRNDPDAITRRLLQYGLDHADHYEDLIQRSPDREKQEALRASAGFMIAWSAAHDYPSRHDVPEHLRYGVAERILDHYKRLFRHRADVEGLVEDLGATVRDKLSEPGTEAVSAVRERLLERVAPIAPTGTEVTTEIIITAWRLYRSQIRLRPAEPKAEATKRRVLGRYLNFTIRRRGLPVGFDNFTQLERDDTKAYRTHLLRHDQVKKTKLASYDILELNGLFNAAREHGDPALTVDLTVTAPRKGGGSRETFEPHEMITVLRAARLASPEVRFAHFLMAYHGVGAKELVMTRRADFVHEGQFHVWAIPGTKSQYRERLHVLHRAVLDEQFTDYLDALPDGPILPSYAGKRGNDYLTADLNALIRSAGIAKSAYAWRHRVSTHYDDAVRETPDGPALIGAQMSHYLMGHTTPESKKALGSGSTMHARYYHPPIQKIAEAIATLPVIDLT